MLALILLSLSVAMADPPEPTLAAMDAALERLGEPGQVDRFQVTTTVRYSDEDGDDAHTDVVVTAVRFGSDGEQITEQLSHVRDGAPLSEEERQAEREERGEGKAGTSMAFVAPAGDDQVHYAYGPSEPQGPVMVASFAPAPGAAGVEDLATGVVAWDPATGRPLWLTFVPVDLPFLVKSLETRLVFGESDGRLHIVRVVSRGVAGPPLLRKRFEFDMRFDGVVWR